MLLTAYLYLANALRSLRREEGQGLVEYALIIVLVAIVIIGALSLLGEEIEDVFQDITTELGGTGT